MTELIGKDLSLQPDEPRSLFTMAAELFTRKPIRMAMIRNGRKFVLWPETGRQALYDLENDPAERRNLLVEGRTGPNGHGSGEWAADLKAWWAENDRLRADDFTLDAENLERLKSLGYIRR